MNKWIIKVSPKKKEIKEKEKTWAQRLVDASNNVYHEQQKRDNLTITPEVRMLRAGWYIEEEKEIGRAIAEEIDREILKIIIEKANKGAFEQLTPEIWNKESVKECVTYVIDEFIKQGMTKTVYGNRDDYTKMIMHLATKRCKGCLPPAMVKKEVEKYTLPKG